MNELIYKRDALHAVLHNEGQAAVAAVENIKAVDAVPVVRCEKCRHGIKGHGISDGWVLCTKPYVTDTVGNQLHRCDWFCADGERKDGERRSDGEQ